MQPIAVHNGYDDSQSSIDDGCPIILCNSFELWFLFYLGSLILVLR
ncbi:hypothetical protein MIS33_10870 [Wielerella bovis]|nr:hypothetical protein [Wielerella bovis]ULJ64614.1 hypothetical protein MIS33_10870 [Wielerella bovis]